MSTTTPQVGDIVHIHQVGSLAREEVGYPERIDQQQPMVGIVTMLLPGDAIDVVVIDHYGRSSARPCVRPMSTIAQKPGIYWAPKASSQKD